VAVVFAVEGVLLIAFPGAARKWAESRQNPYQIRQTPKWAKTEGGFLALGIGLLLAAVFFAYYYTHYAY
jgi:uncharacterized protein YjeT (DUF2065 family)